ncbi:LysR family transcriptional regulator [Mesorhizobium xinjiangense]|uniref:LysR family transcriptional regulator n=1 Tax=Mesorhizobium xinjiangense TaxID=2678685 RepID=UPI0012ED84F4|nr:LysR family transcriptional regulator [Mesorhizobium xinjiangense]
MELKWLEDFVTLAETSSFSRAAELRNVTQSAFSRRIKQLEAWLGATLINRATLPAEITAAGQSFLPVAQDAIRAFYGAREALQPSSKVGMARLAALHTLTVTFFPEWLQTLESEVLDIRTSLIPDRGGIEANLAALIDGEADFFLTYAHSLVPFHLDGERFEFLSVGWDRLVPVAARHVRMNRGQTAPGEGLLDRAAVGGPELPYLSYGSSSFFGVALGRLFADRPAFRHRSVHENTISAGLKTVAMRGAGLCWLPESLIRAELDAGHLVRASTDDQWCLDLEIRLYRHRGSQGRIVRTFWQTAKAVGGYRP